MKRLENALDAYFQRIGLHDQLKARKWLSLWPQIVGSHISRYTRPLVIKDKTLWVEVTDSSWLYHLTSLQDKIKKDFNKKAGYEVINTIKLTNAGSFAEEREIHIAEQIFNKDEIEGEYLFVEEQELIDLERFISSVPALYKDKYRKFIHDLYLQQKIRLHNGATACLFCNLPFYEQEMRDNICFLCFREMEEWTLILKPIFEKTPWLSYTQLNEIYKISEKMFYFCKEKIGKEYYDVIMEFAGLKELDERAEDALHKYLLHYTMFMAEKEPTLISKEDEFKALKVFAGLFDRHKIIKRNN